MFKPCNKIISATSRRRTLALEQDSGVLPLYLYFYPPLCHHTTFIRPSAIRPSHLNKHHNTLP